MTKSLTPAKRRTGDSQVRSTVAKLSGAGGAAVDDTVKTSWAFPRALKKKLAQSALDHDAFEVDVLKAALAVLFALPAHAQRQAIEQQRRS